MKKTMLITMLVLLGALGFTTTAQAASCSDVIWGSLPFAAIMLAFTIVLIFLPELVTWLPAKMR